MREGTLLPGERVYMFFQLRSIFPTGRFTVWSLWGKKLYSLVREYTLYMFFQLRSISPTGRFTMWSLWGKKLYSLVREYTCSFSREAFFLLEGLQCGVYEGRNSIPSWESIHVLSVEKHFSYWKVYSVESMREGTLFPGERVHMFFQFTVWSLWGKELYSLVREYTCSFSWKAFFLLKGFTVHVWGKELYSLVREYRCSFSWEAFFLLKGLQYEVYEGRNSIPWWESIHDLSVEKHYSFWKVYSMKSMREGTLFPGERVYMFFQLKSIFPSGRFTVYKGRNSIPWWGSIHVLSVEKHYSFWKVYRMKSMREGTLFPGEREYMFFQLKSIFPYGRFTLWSPRGKELNSLVRECTCSLCWEAFFPLKGLQCGVYEGRNSIPWWESVHIL